MTTLSDSVGSALHVQSQMALPERGVYLLSLLHGRLGYFVLVRIL
jgi:hypothetical protein